MIQPAYQIGYQGVELLLRQVESGEPTTPVQIRLPAELRVGESTLLRRAEPVVSDLSMNRM
ncbi:MAG: hypothetical protein JWO80_1449 [Bryobacterales bacterium]|nr:hypothetical protein [Bryobacterales bacterium]